MKAGSHFIVGFDSLVLSPELKDKLSKLNPTGIILYDCNIESKEQVKKLIKDLRDLLGENLLVSVDQEGGKVQRLRRICTDLPSYKALGIAARKDFSLVKVHAEILATELSELGFNLVFAPCADLNTNPANPIIGTRSLGIDVEFVSKCLVEIHKTYRDYGLISCAKHYPGHGDAGVDSHLDLPLVKRTNEENNFHLNPFKALVDNGIEMIMLAHLVVNEGLPASINPRIIQSLKQDLNYKGLVISDEITMKALARYGDYNQLSKLLLEAGNDLIIWNTNLDDAIAAAEYLDSFLVEAAKTIASLRAERSGAKQSITTNLQKIAELAVEYRTGKHKNFKFNENTLILINKHPKLEKTILEKVFLDNKIEYIDSKLPDNSVDDALLIEFQISDQDLKLAQKTAHQLLHTSTDINHPEADICLNGASELHYRALLGLLLTSL